jgi:BirA family biotin operon repressor/biotin-[acetyl-CoA-carboxylase] ligase
MENQPATTQNDATAAPAYDLDAARDAVQPFSLLWFAQLPSTNEYAVERLSGGDWALPAIVLTGRQTAGRGQRGNRWWSSDGVLTASFVIPARNDLVPTLMPILAGACVRAAIAELTGSQSAALKWPNDVVFAGRKLAGILCERHRGADIIGVGMNVQVCSDAIPAKLEKRVASLTELTSASISLTNTLICLTDTFRRLLEPQPPHTCAYLLSEYDRFHILVNREIEIDADDGQRVFGVCRGIDPAGRLIVVSADAQNHHVTGRVVHVKHYDGS